MGARYLGGEVDQVEGLESGLKLEVGPRRSRSHTYVGLAARIIRHKVVGFPGYMVDRYIADSLYALMISLKQQSPSTSKYPPSYISLITLVYHHTCTCRREISSRRIGQECQNARQILLPEKTDIARSFGIQELYTGTWCSWLSRPLSMLIL